jgi:hypothetical protein
MGLPDTAETIMTEHDAGNELARLLLPYRHRFSGDEDPPDQENGWVPSSLAGAPAQITGLARLTAAAGGTEGIPK